MRKQVYLTRQQMITDLLGSWKNPYKLSDEELEDYYNDEFYGGFEGITFVLIKE